MKTQFFEQYGDKIEFQNDSDIHEKLLNIDCSVPKRTQGRTSNHREIHCIKIYLMQLSTNKLLRFPLRIEKEEAPDFFILSNGETTTLEVTEASTEDYQRAMTGLERNPDGTLLEALPIFDPGINPPKGEYKKALRTRGEKLIGEGWVGDSVGKVWINIILNAIDKKINSLNEPHFKTADRYELLIYDNSHVAEMVNIKDALPLLKNAVFEKLDPKSKRNFHSISVIHGNKLLYDITNKVLILKKMTDKTSHNNRPKD